MITVIFIQLHGGKKITCDQNFGGLYHFCLQNQNVWSLRVDSDLIRMICNICWSDF